MCLSRAEGSFSVKACNKTGDLVVQTHFGQVHGFCLLFSCSYTGKEYISRSDQGELRAHFQFTVQILQETTTVSDLSRQTDTLFFKPVLW